MKLTPQQEHILSILRDKEWHCSSEFGYIKDDRKRISELNNDGSNGKPKGYMFLKGYKIVGKPCDGRCGNNHSSTLYMRRAEKIGEPQPTEPNIDEYWQDLRTRFDNYQPALKTN